MKKLFLIRNPELFQGEKSLKVGKNYFEGWYFKNSNSDETISFIPGISIENNNKKAFVQVITKDSSYFVDYNINDFKYSHEPFGIQIGGNTFSKKGFNIDIKENKLKISGNVHYSEMKNISTNVINPNIMGPFSYIPSMECNHALLSMRHKINGNIEINDKKIEFNHGSGYIEKDWGYSFPKSYIWCQGNNFQKSDVSFMCSIADIPFKVFHFQGVICVLMIGNQEYKFATYNNSKIEKYSVTKNSIDIILKKGSYRLRIKSEYNKEHKLSAPINGGMEKNIYESVSSFIEVKLSRENNVIFSGVSKNCGLEIVTDKINLS